MATRLKTRIQIEHTLSPEQVKELRGHVAEVKLALAKARFEYFKSWTDGGDPADAPVIEAELALAKAVRAALFAEAAKTATNHGGHAWIPVQMSMEDEDDDWRPF